MHGTLYLPYEDEDRSGIILDALCRSNIAFQYGDITLLYDGLEPPHWRDGDVALTSRDERYVQRCHAHGVVPHAHGIFAHDASSGMFVPLGNVNDPYRLASLRISVEDAFWRVLDEDISYAIPDWYQHGYTLYEGDIRLRRGFSSGIQIAFDRSVLQVHSDVQHTDRLTEGQLKDWLDMVRQDRGLFGVISD